MQLSEEERAELEREAIAAGLDPAAVVAEAEATPEPGPEEAEAEAEPGNAKADEAGQPKGGPAKLGVAPDGTTRVYAYNMIVLKVRELRAFMGFDVTTDDDELYVADFIAKHSPTAKPEAAPPGPEQLARAASILANDLDLALDETQLRTRFDLRTPTNGRAVRGVKPESVRALAALTKSRGQ